MYDDFKKKTIEADSVITKAKDMRAVSEDYEKGFHDAMWEARELFMKVEEEANLD